MSPVNCFAKIVICGMALSLSPCFAASYATTIVKCGTGNAIEYTDGTCKNSSPLPSTDLRAPPISSAEQSAARRRATADKAELTRLETARHLDEQRTLRLHQQQAKNVSHQRRRCEELLLRKKWLDEDRRTANSKATRGINKKSLRLSERYAIECPGFRSAQTVSGG